MFSAPLQQYTVNRYWCWTVVACLAVGVSIVGGDVFTSVQEMERLYHQEERLLKTLESALRFHQSKLDILTQRYTQLMSERPLPSNTADNLGHPVNSFVLIRRLSRDWPLILNIATEAFSIPGDLVNEVQSADGQDIESAVRGLTRLQYVYSLDTDLLADGSVEDWQAYSVLTAADCVEIAQWLLERHEFQLASTWLQTALRRVGQEGDRSVSWEKVISYLHIVNTLGVCESSDFTPLSHQLLRDLVTWNPSFTLDEQTAKWFRLTLSQDCSWFNKTLKMNAIDMVPKDHLMYNEMCAGPVKQPGGLRCHLVHYHNPALRLAPFKLEEVLTSPPIVMVHQVISDQEIQEIQEASENLMIDCEVLQERKSVASTHRMCKKGWLFDDATSVSGRISRRIGRLANLDMESSEANQVGCYGLGGEYKTHYDYVEGMELDKHPVGHRLATVMLYLNDVTRGGYTVFPYLGVAVAPVKGAAIMWFNILYNGEKDPRMIHAGCPVLLGEKWVLNKWIHEGGQNFQTQCPSDKKYPKDFFYL